MPRPRDDQPTAPLADVNLGDIVVLPDGRAMTTRCRVSLPVPAGSMAGFLILDEMAVLLSVPAATEAPVLVYVPVEYLPDTAANSRTVCEGAARYWAPHLPAMGGAMGEILYRVVEIRGSVDPIVIVYRGAEVIVFIRATYAWSDDLQVLRMPAPADTELEVARHTGVVSEPAAVPAPAPVPERERRRVHAGTR